MDRAINNEKLERMMEEQNRNAESRRRVCMLAKAIMSVLEIQPDAIALIPILTNQTRCRSNEEAVRVWITRHLQAKGGLAAVDGTDSPVPAKVLDALDFDALVSAFQAHLYERLPYAL